MPLSSKDSLIANAEIAGRSVNAASANNMANNPTLSANSRAKLAQLLAQLNQVVLDKPQVVKLSVVCLLANGHLLLQDLPGMGKTTLAHALAKLLGLNFNRVQFTNDMLPKFLLYSYLKSWQHAH